MKTFRQIAEGITEALKIVKKKEDKPTTQPQQKKTKKPKGTLVGTVQDAKVYKTFHSTQIRNGDKKPRDYGIKDALILKRLDKMLADKDFHKNTKTIVIYKNSKARYDLMVVIKEYGVINIITFIQGREKDPYNYFTKSRQQEDKIIVENQEISNIIILD